jgi:hypothetical protein
VKSKRRRHDAPRDDYDRGVSEDALTLYSTGLFHKAGPTRGGFLQLFHDGPDEVGIPDALYGFWTLKDAEATGDLNTLRELRLPAERVPLYGEDPSGALRALTATIKETL